MCITINKALLSKTKILSLTLPNGNHFIAYSNKVKNESGKPNAMILPIPGETKPEWFHDTTEYKDFMDEIINKSRYTQDYLGVQMRSLSASKGIQKFELGMYSIGLSNDFKGIEDFIKELPENKKPEVSAELRSFFLDKYAGWAFAICLFDTDKTIDAQPIAFEYKPFSKKNLYFPTMDSHDGGAPKAESNIETDHTFIFEHTGMMDKSKTYAKTFVTLEAKVPEFLQNKRYRAVFSKGYEKNADTYIEISLMTALDFASDPKYKREMPVVYSMNEK